MQIKYEISEEASYWIYPQLVKAGLKIVVEAGDADASVPIKGTLFWLNEYRR